MSIRCPNCKNSSHVKSSREIAPGLVERYMQCQNLECSATFRTAEQFVNFVSKPSDNKLTEQEKQAAWNKCTK